MTIPYGISVSSLNEDLQEVFDNKNNITTSYDSMIAAAIALNLPSYRAISDYFRKNQKKPYKGQYTFKKL